MDWDKIFNPEAIATVGTFCGTIAATIYISFKTFKSKLDKTLEEKKTNVSKNIRRQSNIDYEIIQEADRLKELLSADRVQVYEFHNGTHYANGRSALKTTCTYESCRYGVNSCSNVLSGVPLSVIPNFLKTLLDNGELLVNNLEDIKISMPSTYAIKSTMDIKSFYDVVIYNCNGEPVGFVGVQYCDKTIKKINKDAVKKFAWFIENKLSQM